MREILSGFANVADELYAAMDIHYLKAMDICLSKNFDDHFLSSSFIQPKKVLPISQVQASLNNSIITLDTQCLNFGWW